jgi:hypothetical protein
LEEALPLPLLFMDGGAHWAAQLLAPRRQELRRILIMSEMPVPTLGITPIPTFITSIIMATIIHLMVKVLAAIGSPDTL